MVNEDRFQKAQWPRIDFSCGANQDYGNTSVIILASGEAGRNDVA
jgi:hypothetical protein